MNAGSGDAVIPASRLVSCQQRQALERSLQLYTENPHDRRLIRPT